MQTLFRSQPRGAGSSQNQKNPECVTCQQHSRQGATRPCGGQRTVSHRARVQQRDVNMSGTRREAGGWRGGSRGHGARRSHWASCLHVILQIRDGFLLLKWAPVVPVGKQGILGAVAKPCRWGKVVSGTWLWGIWRISSCTGRNASLFCPQVHTHPLTHTQSCQVLSDPPQKGLALLLLSQAQTHAAFYLCHRKSL